MTIDSLLTQPVVIVNFDPGTADVYGDTAKTERDRTEVLGYLEQTAATEVLIDRETYTSEWLGFLHAGAMVEAASQLIFSGATYEVLGPPNRVQNPRTRVESHIECRLRLLVAG